MGKGTDMKYSFERGFLSVGQEDGDLRIVLEVYML